MAHEKDMMPAVATWVNSVPEIVAAVVYGSRAKPAGQVGSSDRWSDIDLHIVTTDPDKFVDLPWSRIFPQHGFCLQAIRSATGGPRKLSLLFADGELEMVLLRASQLRWASLAMRLGLHRRIGFVREGLNELSTAVCHGRRFLKGEPAWGAFYARVAELPGVRVDDKSVRRLANVFICDLLGLLQWIERGEIAAAQHSLHTRLAQTNFVLLREVRLRRGLPLPSFGIARRVETLLSAEELARVRIDARPAREELRQAAWQAFVTMKTLVAEIDPAWTLPAGVVDLLGNYGIGKSSVPPTPDAKAAATMADPGGG
jgi:hypothetical protein